MEKYIVYITINLRNGKFYVGVHKTNPETFDGYIGLGIYRQNQANQDYPFHRAVRKYGYNNFKRTIIQIFPNTEEGKKEAYALEAMIVNDTLLKSKSVYNILTGGYGGTGYTKKEVYQFALNGKFIKKWNSVKEASAALNISHIDTVCRGERDSAGGFYWSYEKKFKYIPYDNSKQICQYTPSGKYIRNWYSEKEALQELNIVNIHTAIKMKRLCGGYLWRYFTGETSDIEPFYDKRKLSKIFKSPIEQYDLNNKLIKIWNTIDDLELAGFKRNYVRNVIKGKQNTYKGYIFKLQDSDIVSTSIEILSSSLENALNVTNSMEDN